MKIPKKVVRAVEQRRRRIKKALKMSKAGARMRGRVSTTLWLGSVSNFMKLSTLLDDNKVGRAVNLYVELDNDVKETLPIIVVNYLNRQAELRHIEA